MLTRTQSTDAQSYLKNNNNKTGSLLIEEVSGSPSISFKSLGSLNKLYSCLNDGSVGNCVELLVTVK